jgi:hypothetical protein
VPEGQGEGGGVEGPGKRVLLQEGVSAGAWVLLTGLFATFHLSGLWACAIRI